MKIFTLVLVFAVSITATNASTIKLKVVDNEGGKATPLKDAQVQCFDEDFLNTDDRMTDVVTTDSNGSATLTYKRKKGNNFWNPCRGWDCFSGSNPDIYCVVKKPGFLPLYTQTKDNSRQDRVTDFGVVKMYPDRVARGDPGSINGCGPASVWSGVRDVVTFLTGFEDECNNHDLCFNSCTETHESCDLEFLDLMVSNCHDNHDTDSLQSACIRVATEMFNVVRALGGPAFDDAQVELGCV